MRSCVHPDTHPSTRLHSLVPCFSEGAQDEAIGFWALFVQQQRLLTREGGGVATGARPWKRNDDDCGAELLMQARQSARGTKIHEKRAGTAGLQGGTVGTSSTRRIYVHSRVYSRFVEAVPTADGIGRVCCTRAHSEMA